MQATLVFIVNSLSGVLFDRSPDFFGDLFGVLPVTISSCRPKRQHPTIGD
jgi:hypothetical protein